MLKKAIHKLHHSLKIYIQEKDNGYFYLHICFSNHQTDFTIFFITFNIVLMTFPLSYSSKEKQMFTF